MFEGKRVGVIIPAAGRGSRIGTSTPKQFLELDGKPIFIHTFERFQSLSFFDTIIVATDDEHREMVGAMIEPYRSQTAGGMMNYESVVGGEQRQDSVWACLQTLSGHNPPDIVLVHDAVRPFVERDLILEVTHAAIRYGASIPATLPKDTIKFVNGDGFIRSTLERKTLVTVQTPQGFHFRILYHAYDKAFEHKYYGTDDAELVEQCGVKIKIVEGSYRNIKITTSEDLAIARQLLH
jgi:2-C-methyl-D-erythritol 4-phosphate cytidylyltransferase